MVRISPSVLACDFSRLGEEAFAMERAGADMLHLDVMDGHFVPNLTFGAPVLSKLRPHTGLPFDVHLMISDPLRYIGDFAAAGAQIITFHLESDSDAGAVIETIRSHNITPAMAIRPATPAEALESWLDKLGMVLVMTVEPGFGGQKFMEDCAVKCSWLREARNRLGLSFDIQVDGGVAAATAPIAVSYGADILVAGQSLFSKSDYARALRELRESAC